jgi:O-antigen ligase
VGKDNFIPALAPLQKPMPLGLYLQPVHNIFVLVLSETGIIGLIFFMWLLMSTVRRIKKQDQVLRISFFLLLLIIIVTGSFDHYWLTLQQGQLLFTTVIGFSWATLQKF